MSCCNSYKLLDSRAGDQVCVQCGKVERYLSCAQQYEAVEKRNEFIQNICANNHLPKSIEAEAEYLFFKKQQGKGKNKDVYAAYCIYVACKKHNVGRSLIEISKMCAFPVSLLSKFHVPNVGELRPNNLVARVCCKLGITCFPLQREIESLSDKLYSELLNSGPPNSAVATAIAVLVVGLKPANIAWACDISPSCLRRICKIYKHELQEIPAFVSSNTKDTPKEIAIALH